jgi:hypothetical protein
MRNFLCLFIIALLLPACKDTFHDEESSVGKIENAQQLESAISGVYGTFLQKITSQCNIVNDPTRKGDDFDGNPPNGGSTTWTSLYKTILTCNNILVQYGSIDKYDDKTRNILGEVYLFRAYCYFRLTRTYGQVLIIKDIDIKCNTDTSSFEEIYQFIESDLQKAIDLLPLKRSLARVPNRSPFRATAKALLAEVYLSWAGYPCKDNAKYDLAAKEAGEVIDSASFYEVRLEEDFAALWDDQIDNKEGLFTIYNSPILNASIMEAWYNFYWGMFSTDGFYDCYLLPGVSFRIELFNVHSKFYNNFPRGYRRDITFFNYLYPPSAPNGIYYDHLEPENTLCYRKFFYNLTYKEYSQVILDKNGDTIYNSTKDLIIGSRKLSILRYAQTLLTYAEAKIRSGEPDNKAIECVNMVRRRANKVNLSSPSQYDLPAGLSTVSLLDSIVWERAWELTGEMEGRWFDLVRLEKVEDLPNLIGFDGTPPSFDKSYYYYPIPKE